MKFSLNCLKFRPKNLLIIAVISVIVVWLGGMILEAGIKRVKINSLFGLSADSLESNELPLIQGNSFLAVCDPFISYKQPKKIKMIVTAYSSTVWETDNDPFITASGSQVKDGLVANNLLPFGTKVMIPELYGNKVFTVEDRMNQRKGIYHLDIWFPEYHEAKDFGAKTTYVELL